MALSLGSIVFSSSAGELYMGSPQNSVEAQFYSLDLQREAVEHEIGRRKDLDIFTNQSLMLSSLEKRISRIESEMDSLYSLEGMHGYRKRLRKSSTVTDSLRFGGLFAATVFLAIYYGISTHEDITYLRGD